MNLEHKSLNLNNEGASWSYKFGFLGIGMGGTSIAAACADITTSKQNEKYPYTALLINSNTVDLEKVKPINPTSVKLAIGNGRGAGRNIEIGEKLYKMDVEKIENAIDIQFKDSDFVWLVVGLGGGTGTGAIIQALKSLWTKKPKQFGLILTLPRDEEGSTVVNNALQRVQQIYQAMNNLGPIILVDNKKLFLDYVKEKPNASIAEYLQFSNRYVAEALHDLNVITSSYIPFGDSHFDSSELGTMLRTPGLIHFARFTTKASNIDVGQTLSYSERIKTLIQDGVLSDGYQLEKSKRAALSILTSTMTSKRLYTLEFSKELEGLVDTLAPAATEKPVALYTHNVKENANDVSFYAVFAGLDLPADRIKSLIQISKEAAEKERINSLNVDNDLFADFEVNKSTPKNEKSFDDLFGSTSAEEEKTNKEENNDEMLKLFGL